MRISDWSSDVCSSDLNCPYLYATSGGEVGEVEVRGEGCGQCFGRERRDDRQPAQPANAADFRDDRLAILDRVADEGKSMDRDAARSEEHTSELQSLMRISYAVFCLKKKK